MKFHIMTVSGRPVEHPKVTTERRWVQKTATETILTTEKSIRKWTREPVRNFHRTGGTIFYELEETLQCLEVETLEELLAFREEIVDSLILGEDRMITVYDDSLE